MCPTEADVPGKRVTVGGVSFDPLTEARVVKHVRAALGRGQGGRILTPNVDILRQIQRDPTTRDVLDDTSLIVADGMPVIWASRLAGTPLPQRVSGADLIWSLSRGLGRDGRSVFVLGGQPAGAHAVDGEADGEAGGTDKADAEGAADTWAGALVAAPSHAEPAGWASTGRHAANAYRDRAEPEDPSRRNAGPSHRAGNDRGVRNTAAPWQRDARRPPDGAGRCAAVLAEQCPGLNVAGAISPPYGFDGDPEALDAIRAEIVAARPDLILVGIGFPRQERVIAALRTQLPSSWFLGCGMAIGFVAGDQRRAPTWMRRGGVEWMHRLASEPHRLAERYLRHDLPFAVSLLTTTAIARVRPERAERARPSGDGSEVARVEVGRARHRRERG
jgi:UDP-N-acetyl-D-mannosaminuronic acid transferase (WecB/TagA/CpsF family)